MKGFLGLTKRNLLIFFKDKQAIVFSLLTSIIFFVLYILFLKGSFVDAINGALEGQEQLKELISSSDIEMFSNITLLVGILGSAMITVPFNCLTTVVRDKEFKIDYDILATPIKRGEIILSYFVSAFLSAIFLTGTILTVGLVILCNMGELHLSAIQILGVYGIVALGSISSTAIFMILVLAFKSTSASGAFFGMLSSASGFVIGAYIPISQFSKAVQSFCNAFPASQVTVLLRNALLVGVTDAMNTSIGGIDNGMFVDTLKAVFYFDPYLLGNTLNRGQMLAYVTLGCVVCIALMVIIYSKTYKRK